MKRTANETAPNMQETILHLLQNLGEDPEREGLIGTPARVEKMYQELCAGYQQNVETVVNGAIFHEESDGMILIKNIEFYSLCEHHLLPFFGWTHVAYLPDHCIIGLSKVPRIVELFARRLQVQERLTREIRETLDDVLAPKGCAVLVDASHLCARMRGVQKDEARLVTTSFSGDFEHQPELRREFLSQVGKRRGPSQKTADQ